MAAQANFTNDLVRALANANAAAKSLGHNYIGTEHLLLGVLSVEDSATVSLLNQNNLNRQNVRETIVQMVGNGDYQFSDEFEMTIRTRNLISRSTQLAKAQKHKFVTLEHLILAIIEERSCIAAKVMMHLDVDMEGLKRKLMDLLAKEMQQRNAGQQGKETMLDKFCTDMTMMAKQKKYDPLVGRDGEIERVIQILLRRTKNNPVLVGAPGVGKTAIVEGIAQRIVSGTIPELLRNYRILSLDLAAIVAGAKYRGEFEERMKQLVDELVRADHTILFIDEIHSLMNAGGGQGSIGAADILKPALSRGQIQTIGATTQDEYMKYIEADSAMERRFQKVTVEEPTAAQAVSILKGLRPRYEAYHNLQISDAAIEAAVYMTQRYISERSLPDKAIDAMDEACSRMRLVNYCLPPDLDVLEDECFEVIARKDIAIRNQNFEKAAQLRDEEKRLVGVMQQMKEH